MLRSEGADVSALRRLVRTHVTGARQARYPLYKQANAMFAKLIWFFSPRFPKRRLFGRELSFVLPRDQVDRWVAGFFSWRLSGGPKLFFQRNVGMYDGTCSVEKILSIF